MKTDAQGNPALSAAATLAIGHALFLSYGIYNPAALAWVAAATALAWGAFFLRAKSGFLAAAICAAGILWIACEIPPARHSHLLPAAMGLAALLAMLLKGISRNICLAALIVLFLVQGLRVLREPAPRIDVYEVTRDACVAISQGKNPYAIDFPDLYADRPDWEKAFYPPGYLYDGRVHFGYQYMPLSLMIDWAGHALGGDYRWASLLAVAAAAILLALAQPGWTGAAAAGLLLLLPGTMYVVQFGWAEPVVVLSLAFVICAARRWPAALPFAAGLLLASKQHLPLAAPALWLIMRRPKQWLIAILTAGAVTMPIILWNPAAFWHSAIVVQLVNPFRYDSLNFAALWTKLGHAPPPGAISFALAGAAAALVAWRGSRTPAAMAGGVAAIYLTFFALSKQTFCNYYFLAAGALCCALAASGTNAAHEPAPHAD